MTETPKKTKSQELQEQISKQEKALEELKTSLTTLTQNSHRDMESAEQHLENCPTCKAKVKAKLTPEIETELKAKIQAEQPPAIDEKAIATKALKEYFAKLPKQLTCKCKGCNEIVERTTPKCPYCGSTEGTECQ